ncbi:MAG TPA: hypothetical protein VFQ39_19265 [Longimicrobium sp.]|nr:hypothetical protein [Longimicrobium sp.]
MFLSRFRFALAAALLAGGLFASPAAAQGRDATIPAPADSTRWIDFARAVAGHLRARGIASPNGRVVVRAQPGPSNLVLRLQASNVPASENAALGAFVDSLVTRFPTSAPLELSFDLARLPAADGGPPLIGAGPRVVEHQPRLKNRSRIVEYMGAVFAGRRTPAPVVLYRATLGMLVNEAGETALVHVRSGTGDPYVDGYLTALGHELRFEPARVGNRRVPVYVVVPLMFCSVPESRCEGR